ncbi:MAG: hypothetical protein QGI68_11325 [Pseudomonadales bacterium]|nr:hypothetical protein [Pseudomonadales bacterium]MDP7147037.1 hypothetical protein [Pseudomonadales bacterium]MDP7359195.1 hypothetical protein [Pseudomonadales bacterium]MDP7596143.1 hypothetical protein [Pseudomonadales bacterium]HJN50693.1 hypothetical protein [Pseudomonadales bacterium]
MRTTLTLDDAVDRKLKKIAKQTGKTYKQVVNETLQRGLAKSTRPRRRYKLKTSSLGEPDPSYDLTKSLQLADQLEDDEIVRKLKLRK